MMMFSTLVSVYLTIATVDGKPNEVFFLLFLCKKVVRIRLLKLERLVTKYSRIKMLTLTMQLAQLKLDMMAVKTIVANFVC